MLSSKLQRNTILSVVICMLNNGVMGEPSCSPQFYCIANAPESYQLYGVQLTCPLGFVCNADYDMMSCDPCVVLSAATCGFECSLSDLNSGTITTLGPKALRPFTCPAGQVCNSQYETCAPCIDKIECLKFWTCNLNNPSEVYLFGITLPCGAGKVCNKNYKLPCDACIIDTTVIPTTTIKPTGQYPPNCNDGLGTVNRCRPGPPGSGYYYKCIPVGMVFDFAVKLCTGLAADSLLYHTLTLWCFIALVSCSSAYAGQCSPQFKCWDAHHYQILGYNGTCEPGFVCNQENPDDCNPCVELNDQTCQFKCDPASTHKAILNISGTNVTITCNEGERCNFGYMDTCAPCIAETCNTDNWKCNADRENEVIVRGLSFECRDRKVCNKDYKYPCDMCVDKNPGMTYPPNCNDGEGYSNPCRLGAIGSNKYYVCKKVGKYYFDFEEKKCLWKFLDKTCKKNKEICT